MTDKRCCENAGKLLAEVRRLRRALQRVDAGCISELDEIAVCQCGCHNATIALSPQTPKKEDSDGP